MTIYTNVYYSRTFTVTDAAGVAIDITGWTFRAMFRDNKADVTEIVELTSAGGGFGIVDAAAGQFQLILTAVQTALFPIGKVVFDVLRTDGVDAPVYLFEGRVPVREPITHD